MEVYIRWFVVDGHRLKLFMEDLKFIGLTKRRRDIAGLLVCVFSVLYTLEDHV